MLNLDTHILVFFAAGNLAPQEYDCVAKQELVISDIVFWELAMLEEDGRLSVDLEDTLFRSFLRTIRVIPISLEISRQSTQLDFSSDPADEIIAATSVVEKIPLLTRDRRIRKSRMVPLAL
ncbi:MAG TPA: PIN domain-containing protein [Terriglobia bacterium]|nr:PIN domain-containing protein [Terriglobia bacterium]